MCLFPRFHILCLSHEHLALLHGHARGYSDQSAQGDYDLSAIIFRAQESDKYLPLACNWTSVVAVNIHKLNIIKGMA